MRRRTFVLGTTTLAVFALLAPTQIAHAAEDPLVAQQWGLAAIEAKAAWPLARGAGVTIAVIDSGSGPHPDLDANLDPGRTMFAGSDAAGGTDVDDVKGHGSHVAGIAAAVAGNGIGGAGVAPAARILPIQVLNAAGSGDGRDVARAIRLAVDSGARVVNLSLGGDQESPSIASAVQYAVSRDALVVAAAGNGGPAASPKWPAADDATIAVTAIDRAGGSASFSQRGGYIDLAAPGTAILSTARGQYEELSGSSMAAAFVSGVAALLFSARGELTAREVREILEATATDIGPPGRDDTFGVGVVNARAALTELAVRYPGIGAPVVSGEPHVGRPLIASSTQPGLVRWWRCPRPGPASPTIPKGCVAIRGANRARYRPTAADLRSNIRVSIGGTERRSGSFSAATRKIVAIWPLASTVAPGSRTPLAELVAIASPGRSSVTVARGACRVVRASLVAPDEPQTCRLRITVAASGGFPQLRLELTVDVAAEPSP